MPTGRKCCPITGVNDIYLLVYHWLGQHDLYCGSVYTVYISKYQHLYRCYLFQKIKQLFSKAMLKYQQETNTCAETI